MLAQVKRIHGHRAGSGEGGPRRMLPKPFCKFTLQGHSSNVTCVTLHPIYTVAVSASDDGTIKVWDHESGEYLKTLKGHTGPVNSICFTPTGSHLASASSDLSIKLWEWKTYRCIRTLPGHDHTISAVCFLPLLEKVVVEASDGDVDMSSSSSGIDVGETGSTCLVSTSRDRTVKFWELETGFCIHTLSDHTDWVRCVAVRYDGQLLATSGNDTIVYLYKMLSTDRKKIGEFRGHTHVVESLAFVTKQTDTKKTVTNNVDNYLASGGRDRTVRLWNTLSMECLCIFTFHENWVRSVIIHPTGNYIISAGDDRSIRVLDIKSNRCFRTIENAQHFITSIAMHPTLPILVSGSVDHTLKCWELE